MKKGEKQRPRAEWSRDRVHELSNKQMLCDGKQGHAVLAVPNVI